ncbi:MAG TPA: GH116 family glycosyl hydrolase, partial [Acidobacteriota bacterium]|nr:GH116 family glycosyl hydrolase [Acidobacteriota bacterium]
AWDDALKAYVISESTRRNHGLIGSPAATGISYTPAHMLSDVPNQFKIAVDKPKDVEGKYIPIVMAGGKGSRDAVIEVYRKLAADPGSYCRDAEEHYAILLASTLRLQTPDPDLDLAFAWAKIGYDSLVADNPDLGRGLVAGLGPSGTGGRPGFGWFFGGDAFINVLSLDSLGNTAAAKEALAFSRKWQRQDGKMAHELSQAAAYIDWWGDYPYGYIHGDTTPLYIVATDDYYAKTGDLEFVRAGWESLKQAYAWCLSTDEDGDGLMDNAKAGLGALEFGSLTGIRTDIYLAAVWAKACEGIERLARAAGDTGLSKKAEADHARAVDALKLRFWDGENGRYAHAIDKDGRLVRELTPWSAAGLMWGFGDRERGVSSLEKICAAELTTDWGVRTLSVKSPLFEPLNYNYGAVWPFLTGWVAAAQFKNELSVPGYGSLMSSVRHTFDNALGCSTEVFSGARNVWPAEAVPHQGFSGGSVVLPFVKGLLGLEGSAPEKWVSFEPRLPADWGGLSVEGFKVGEADVAVRYTRSEGKVMAVVASSAPAGWRMIFRPSFGPGTTILSASVNGKPAAFVDAGPATLAVRPSVEFPLTGKDSVEIGFEPTVEVLPPAVTTRTGDADRGLKVIRVDLSAPKDGLEVVVEGLAGETYELPVARADKILSVAGAELADKGLI